MSTAYVLPCVRVRVRVDLQEVQHPPVPVVERLAHLDGASKRSRQRGRGDRGLDPLHQGDHVDWEEMIDTNVKGLLWVSRAVLPGMAARDRGHVVNIGSIAGHEVYPNGNVYCATKAAVSALGHGMRIDLKGTRVRVSNVDPGMVESEFSLVRFHGDQERAAKVYRNFPPLQTADVADAVLYCVTRPAHVNISELVLWPTDQKTATINYPRGIEDAGRS